MCAPRTSTRSPISTRWVGRRAAFPRSTFDPNQYLAAYPDVAAAHIDPLAHFLQNGYQEGRQPFAPTELIAANGFDYVYYLSHNPDVAAAHVDPLSHFQTVGWQEGRNPNALFDTAGYLATYADVAAAHVNPLDHYNQFGLARRTRPVGRLRHDRVSCGLCRRGGRRRQSAGALSPVRPARRPLDLRRRRLGIGPASVRPALVDQLCRHAETVLSPRPFAEGEGRIPCVSGFWARRWSGCRSCSPRRRRSGRCGIRPGR